MDDASADGSHSLLFDLLDHLRLLAQQSMSSETYGVAVSERMKSARSILIRETEILRTSLEEAEASGVDVEHFHRSIYALMIVALNVGGTHSISEIAVMKIRNITPQKARKSKAGKDLARIAIQEEIIGEFAKGKDAKAITAFVRNNLDRINAIARKRDVPPDATEDGKGISYTASLNTWIDRLKAVKARATENQH